MSEAPRYEYAGDPALQAPVEAALRKVADPEMSLGIVEVGLVYHVEAHPGRARVRLTMTSPACPVVEVIVDDVRHELSRVLGEGSQVDVDIVWDPPWSPERMSERARAAMGW